MSRAAQAIAEAVKRMGVRPRRGFRRRAIVDDDLRLDDSVLDDGADPAPAPAAGAEGDEVMAKKTKKAKGAPRKAKADRPAKVPRTRQARAAQSSDALSGLKRKPKNKILFLNTAIALSVVQRALESMTFSDPDEAREVTRLLARIAART